MKAAKPPIPRIEWGEYKTRCSRSLLEKEGIVVGALDHSTNEREAGSGERKCRWRLLKSKKKADSGEAGRRRKRNLPLE